MVYKVTWVEPLDNFFRVLHFVVLFRTSKLTKERFTFSSSGLEALAEPNHPSLPSLPELSWMLSRKKKTTMVSLSSCFTTFFQDDDGSPSPEKTFPCLPYPSESNELVSNRGGRGFAR